MLGGFYSKSLFISFEYCGEVNNYNCLGVRKRVWCFERLVYIYIG